MTDLFKLQMPSIVKSTSQLSTFNQVILMLIGAAALSISFLESDYFYLAWLAFIPMLFAIKGASWSKTYALGLLAGVTSFASGEYWIVDFAEISKGFTLSKSIVLASVYWFYCGHLVAFMMVLFQWLKRKTDLHEFVIFPVVVTGFTSAYPMLFSMRLGDSQAQFPVALQAIEFVGVHGLDAIIALVNVLLYRGVRVLIRGGSAWREESKQYWAASILLILLWFGYGHFQYSSWSQKIDKWDTLKVGIVQPNEIPKIGKRALYAGYSLAYPPEMEMTERLSAAGAELIVLPEAQVKEYLNNANVRRAFQAQISALGSTLVFQDIERIRNTLSGEDEVQFSSAIMLNEQGRELGQYQKIKRIPFGEYLPLVPNQSMAKKALKNLFGEFYVELSAGDTHQVFNQSKVNLIPLICYETTFPSFVGEAVKSTIDTRDNGKGSLLVALTNDGWFGSTHQPYQHVMPSILRAVENRLPLIHAANNGPSIVVMPHGELVFESDFQQAGGYLVDVPNSPEAQGSFYSQYPHLFERMIYLSLGLLLLRALFGRKTR